MSRPLYESAADLAAEKAFMHDIESRRGVKLIKLPIHYKVDAICLKDKMPIAWMEMKIRRISLSSYPTIILSLKKVTSGLKLRRHLWQPILTQGHQKQLQFLFLIRLLDGDYYTKLTEAAVESYNVTTNGGRTRQTRDEYDIEPVVEIPTSAFQRL